MVEILVLTVGGNKLGLIKLYLRLIDICDWVVDCLVLCTGELRIEIEKREWKNSGDLKVFIKSPE